MSILVDRPDERVSGDREATEAELASLRTQLREAQRLASVGVAAAMAIHEFRNIFTPLANYARRAAKGSESALGKTVRLAMDGAPRAVAVCQALLDLAGDDPAEQTTVRVAELVEQTLVAMGRDLAKDGIVLVRKIPPKLTVRTRPGQLKQVLLNLILNARAAAMAKGPGQSIELRAQRRKGEVLIQVGDTGVGMDRDVMNRVFEPFFSTRGKSGSGLGLPVCRRIVEGFNGRINVRSQIGRGSWFTVALPDTGSDRPPRNRAAKSA